MARIIGWSSAMIVAMYWPHMSPHERRWARTSLGDHSSRRGGWCNRARGRPFVSAWIDFGCSASRLSTSSIVSALSYTTNYMLHDRRDAWIVESSSLPALDCAPAKGRYSHVSSDRASGSDDGQSRLGDARARDPHRRDRGRDPCWRRLGHSWA